MINRCIYVIFMWYLCDISVIFLTILSIRIINNILYIVFLAFTKCF
nr:MAG TPA: hypothetical protein [Caudoviricetes sp.]